MTRIKVIPKRPLRLWEPIAWGLVISIALNALFIRELYSMNSEFMPFLAGWIVAICLFPLADAYAHRTYERVAKRSTVFGITLGAWVPLLHINQPYMQIRLLDGEIAPLLIGSAASAAAGACACGFVSLLITFLLRKFLGHHRVHPCGLCTGCAYPLEGLDSVTNCPECGRDRALPPRPVWKHSDFMRTTAWSVITITLAAQLALGVHLFATRTVPMLRFRSAVPSNETTGTNVLVPIQGAGPWADEQDGTCLMRNFEVAHIASPMGLDITALHAKFFLPRNDAPRVIEFRIGKASITMGFTFGGSGDRSRLIRSIRGEQIEAFYDNGGVTDELITDLLETYKRRIEGKEIPTINLPN